jgi:hypothetical protein
MPRVYMIGLHRQAGGQRGDETAFLLTIHSIRDLTVYSPRDSIADKSHARDQARGVDFTGKPSAVGIAAARESAVKYQPIAYELGCRAGEQSTHAVGC